MSEDLRTKGMNRQQRREMLRQQSQKRQNQMGAPNFGVSEKKLLAWGQMTEDLRNSNNKMVGAIQELNDKRIVDKALESHYMMLMLTELLVEKGIFTQAEIQAKAEAIQGADLGLLDKAKDSVVEPGDHMLMKFKLFDGDKLVDSQWDAPVAYIVGSKDFNCEDGMIGMRVGEVRTLSITFGQGFKFKEYVNKPLTIQIACVGLKVLDPAKFPHAAKGAAVAAPAQPTM